MNYFMFYFIIQWITVNLCWFHILLLKIFKLKQNSLWREVPVCPPPTSPPPPHVRAVRVPIHWWLISKNHLVRSAISFSMKCYWSNSPTIVWRSFTCKSKKILILTFVLEILGCTYCKFSILQLIYITNDMIYMQLILHQQIPASSVHKHDIP